MALELNSMVVEFDRLPGELRNEIYTLVFTLKDPIYMCLNSNEPFWLRARDLHGISHCVAILKALRRDVLKSMSRWMIT
jgi:hypothetical protein